jgi:broad specificity phosphatase PhoE
VTTLLLARHGETDWNREGRLQGHADQPLNDVGREQARALARSLTGEALAAIYSSDLLRALETAEIVAAVLGLPVVTVPELREADVGEFEGLTQAEIDTKFPDRAERVARLGYAFATGEGHPAVTTRLLQALTRIAVEHEGETVLVVSHGGAIRVVLAHVEGLDLEQHRHRIAPTVNGGVFRVRFARGAFERL